MYSKIFYSRTIDEKEVRINQNEIVYMKVIDKYIDIFTYKDVYSVRGSLDNILSNLGDNFFRISRNIIVNFNNVSSITDKEVEVFGKERFIISRRRRKAVIESYRNLSM